MTGFAVVDLETTGFAYNHTDRVCDIGRGGPRHAPRE